MFFRELVCLHLLICASILSSSLAIAGERTSHGAMCDSLKLVPLESLKMEDISVRSETLRIVSGADFVHFPLGTFSSFSGMRKKYKGIAIKKCLVKESFLNVYSISLRGNHFIVIQDEERQFRIVSGSITDSMISLQNGVHLRMGKIDFLRKFFRGLGNIESLSNLDVIELISAVDGSWHYYEFHEGILTRISFRSDFVIDGLKTESE